MKIMTGGELVVESLVNQGVRCVFSIIGGQMGTMYDAIGKNPRINVVTPRSETSTAIMACGYTASTGIPSVSMATVGAGVVYEVAGLLKAWLSYLPIVSIAPQVQSHKMKPHQENLQACEQDLLFEPLTKFNAIVHHWRRIPQLVDRAFREAQAGVPGPVHLDIPVDVLFKHRVMTPRRRRRMMVPPARSRYIGPIKGSQEALDAAAGAVAAAKKPLVIVGQGMGRAGRFPRLAGLLDALDIPASVTLFSSGVLQGANACFAGDASLFLDSPEGEKILAESDCCIVLGIDPQTRRMLARAGAPSASTALVQVETDPQAMEIGEGVFPVYADPVTAVERFQEALNQKKGRRPAAWKKKVSAFGSKAAKFLLDQAGPGLKTAFEFLEEDSTAETLFVADGEAARFAPAFFQTRGHKGLFVMDQDDMGGAGLPFALGAALGNPDASVVLICGKESLFHHLRELQPAAELGAGLTILCVDSPPDEDNGADSRQVLEAFDCYVHRAGDKTGLSGVLRRQGQTAAVLV